VSPTRASTVALGTGAEESACRYLLDRGLRLIARNYRCRYGEIDLIMGDDSGNGSTNGSTIVFVEVRMRSRTDFGSGAQSVDSRKQRRILRSAEHYLKRRATLLARCRFDVVSIHRAGNEHRINWIQNAFHA
jgi:putative endonuclease